MNTDLITRFAPVIRALTPSEINDSKVLQQKLEIARQDRIQVCYTPFEYLNKDARVVIVGITPGATQLMNAVKEVRRQLDMKSSYENALKEAKATGAFSGAIRPNLTGMLDSVGIAGWLGIKSCDELFTSSKHLVQTSSALRNAVFVDGENYSGSPNMVRTSVLRDQLLSQFAHEAQALSKAVFIPLGDKVSEALHFLAKEGILSSDHILDGLPHPSGANAERIAYFLGRKERSALSAKTNPEKIDLARAELISKIKALKR
ncbi:hypothetical protein [Comamonas aquatica]|uniref:hypothetical protein n=1 Tax=Comamonas aquatica TaxID=225991 RepID=UPI0009DFFA39|nr:hypothetical protein [Comamonas aquatica]